MSLRFDETKTKVDSEKANNLNNAKNIIFKIVEDIKEDYKNQRDSNLQVFEFTTLSENQFKLMFEYFIANYNAEEYETLTFNVELDVGNLCFQFEEIDDNLTLVMTTFPSGYRFYMLEPYLRGFNYGYYFKDVCNKKHSYDNPGVSNDEYEKIFNDNGIRFWYDNEDFTKNLTVSTDLYPIPKDKVLNIINQKFDEFGLQIIHMIDAGENEIEIAVKNPHYKGE